MSRSSYVDLSDSSRPSFSSHSFSSHLFFTSVSSGCGKNTFECYFQQLTGCHVTPSDVADAIVITDSEHVHGPPYSEEKFLYLKEYPTSRGICRMCGDEWTGDTSFFDGLHYGGYYSHNILYLSIYSSVVHYPAA